VWFFLCGICSMPQKRLGDIEITNEQDQYLLKTDFIRTVTTQHVLYLLQ